MRRSNRVLRDLEMRMGDKMEIQELEGAVTMENIWEIKSKGSWHRQTRPGDELLKPEKEKNDYCKVHTSP